MTTFVHRPYVPGETIAAIATPPGEGGVAIVRICGAQAFAIAEKVFSKSLLHCPSHTAHFGRVVDAAGSRVDDALALVMRGPSSYTGEDTVELQCHGGSLIARRVLDTVLAAGVRLARAGEFTLRAFLNGKIDLAQAEAVQALIGAKSEQAVDAAHQHLQGALSSKISSFQRQLFDIAAVLEAWVDFPEEGLEFASFEELQTLLGTTLSQMEALVATFHDGKMVHEGISICLVGSPNVGKSSLMNALLDKDRAIVTDIAGTTRDLLEDHLRLNGLHVKLIDTAGLRDTTEHIEKEGIRRSQAAMSDADLVLLVLDASLPLDTTSLSLLDQLRHHPRAIAIWNKMDIALPSLPHLPLAHCVHLSARDRTGLDLLRDTIDKVIWHLGPPAKDEIILTSLRHKDALSSAIAAGHRVLSNLSPTTSPEFLTFDMREALSHLGTILGCDISEDLLSAIFSKFCIGK